MSTGFKLRPVTPNSILAAELKSIVEVVESKNGWDDTLTSQLKRLSMLAAGIDEYVERCTTPQSESLREVQAATNRNNWQTLYDGGETVQELESEMLSGHVEGQFLKFLIAISQAKRVLEIGMFTGYATLAMAEALPADGRIVACELDPFAAKIAQNEFFSAGQQNKIEVLIGSAHESIVRLADENASFDLVFIDAEKSGYIDYLKVILDRNLLTTNGFIVVDNTLMQGQPFTGEITTNGEAIREFNEFVIGDLRVEQVLVPLRDGLTLIRRSACESGVQNG